MEIFREIKGTHTFLSMVSTEEAKNKKKIPNKIKILTSSLIFPGILPLYF